MQLQQHHFGGPSTGLPGTSSSSSGSSSVLSGRSTSGGSSASTSGGESNHHHNHHMHLDLLPSTSGGHTGNASTLGRTLVNSTSSTPLHAQRPMYRLSSFIRPPTLGLGSSSTGALPQPDSPTTTNAGTPLDNSISPTESELMRAAASTSSILMNTSHPGGPGSHPHHTFHRQSSQTTSPPSSITTNVPTYETIDVQNLSHHHLTGYNPAASTLDYCSSTSAGSGQSQTSACGMDQSSTAPIMVPDNQRLVYPYGPMVLGGGRAGPGYLSRNQGPLLRYPHPTSDGSAYYSIYGNGGSNGGYGRSSESGIYSPTRLRSDPKSHQFRKACESTEPEDFDIANAIFALISLTSYLICVGASGALAYFFHHHEHDTKMCALTLGATLLPSIIVNILSLKWLLNDNHRQQKDPEYPVKRPEIGPCGWTFRILLHICLLGPALRYVDLLRYGVSSWTAKRRIEQRKEHGTFWPTTTLPSLSTTLPRPRYLGDGLPNFDTAQKQRTSTANGSKDDDIDYYLLTVYEDRDSALLSLFRSLLQCTVQLILQLYSLLHYYQLEHVHNHSSEYNHQFTEYVQLTVIGTSLFEISWSLASYHRSLRRASLGKRTMSSLGMILQFVWHAGTTGSRVLAVALFINQYGAWLAPITIGHWGIMTVWIMHQGTHFMDDPHHLSEYLFAMLVGAIYLVQYLNVKDEPTRYKYSWYYAIVGAENVTLAILWAIRVSESAELEFFWLRIPAMGAVVGSFAVGIIAMQLYYWCVHPSGRPLWVNKAARCC